ncbi:MAG TPA: cation-translocating P-type ATPase [Ktedonobacterales bacterium]
MATETRADERLDVSLNGLSEREAANRLRADGPNELPTGHKRGPLRIIVEVAREPMLLFLVATALVYMFLGDPQEAALLLASAVIVVGITVYQEGRAERALEALRDLSSPRALVIRDGERRRIAGREVVRGDLLVLSEGDRVPADATIVSGASLSADESLLTGESVPVSKVALDPDHPVIESQPGGDQVSAVYSGTLITQGQGYARATAIGAATEIGKIGRALHEVEAEETPLQAEIKRIVRVVAIIAVSVCVIVALSYIALRHDWLGGLLAGLTLAMAMIPEEFPVIMTIFLALGAWRIAQRHALTRRMPALQALGAATALCVDKTGTLTLNLMEVQRIFADGIEWEPAPPWMDAPAGMTQVARAAALASAEAPFDPMERAIHETAGQLAPEYAAHLMFVREYPLRSDLLALTRAWRTDGAPDGEYILFTKGAPEAVADLCRVTPEEREALHARLATLTAEGLRALGVAQARYTGATLPDSPTELTFEFLGFIGLADPIRPSVPGAISACHDAGVRVIMITGDYPGTALAIARQIGLRPADSVLTGAALGVMSDEELRRRIASASVFARVVPEQKLRIVNALKANGEIVAMTGDGVNDAPALKAAHIGIAMGGRGTDVAREAAAMVLLDDTFDAIVEAVRLGRRIFDNLRKAMAYIVAVHIPIAGLAMLPALLNLPLILLPAHIVFLELIIDPACSIIFEAEPEESDVMARPPRDPHEAIFSRRVVVISAIQGAGALMATLAIYLYGVGVGAPEPRIRAMTFTTLVVANLALIFINRSWTRGLLATLRTPNAALWWVMGGALALLAITLFVPPARDLFAFGALSAGELAVSVLAGLAGGLWFELIAWTPFVRGARRERAASVA